MKAIQIAVRRKPSAVSTGHDERGVTAGCTVETYTAVHLVVDAKHCPKMPASIRAGKCHP
jgi:hypothetical protein